MQIISQIFFILCFAINATAVTIVVIRTMKLHALMERKQDEMLRHIRRVANRNDIVYVSQLHHLKSELIQAERYEDAQKIDLLLKQEMERIEPNNGTDEKD